MLVVDDEPMPRQMFTDLLEAHGFKVITVARGEEAFAFLQEVELVSPGSAERLIRESTRDQRFVLQAAGYYDKLPWKIRW